ncbi:MAG: DUF4349 domain-containing protein [Candidatus Sulfotelmatobacter sp.]
MSTSAVVPKKRNNIWMIGLAGIAAILVVAATNVSRLNHSQTAANQDREYAMQSPVAEAYQAEQFKARIHQAALASTSTAMEPEAAPPPADSPADRKMVRTSSMDLVVRKPAAAAEKIRVLAENMGGFLVTSEMSGGLDESGSLTVRVPAARFEEAREEIRKLGLRVESEKIEAQDVTRQYVDQEANLRNLKAEEAQYLTILKQARTVKDTLEVSEKLSAVRGQIEQQQAEFDALSKQIETVAITVSLRAEAEAQVFGLRWRPLYQMKLALRGGLDAVAGYAAAMTAMVFYLPAVLLWLVTIVVGAAVGWKILRWIARVFFAWPKQAVAQNS